jgi:hypothetical protein
MLTLLAKQSASCKKASMPTGKWLEPEPDAGNSLPLHGSPRDGPEVRLHSLRGNIQAYACCKTESEAISSIQFTRFLLRAVHRPAQEASNRAGLGRRSPRVSHVLIDFSRPVGKLEGTKGLLMAGRV